jgi:hypothetical protein
MSAGDGVWLQSDELVAPPNQTTATIRLVVGTRSFLAGDRFFARYGTDATLATYSTSANQNEAITGLSAYDPATISLTGLTANTQYYYQLCYEDASAYPPTLTIGDKRSFKTADPTAANDVTFVMQSDAHHLWLVQEGEPSVPLLALGQICDNNIMAELAGSDPPDFCVRLGDEATSHFMTGLHFPIDEDGTQGFTLRYATEEADCRKSQRLERRQRTFPWHSLPTHNPGGNHEQGHWHWWTANNGGTTDAGHWMHDAAVDYLGKPTGLSATPTAAQIHAGNASGLWYWFDWGCARFIIFNPFVYSQWGKTHGHTFTDSYPPPNAILPYNMHDMLDWTMGLEEIEGIFGPGGPVQTFPDSGLSWLHMMGHQIPAGSSTLTYAWGLPSVNAYEWGASDAWKAADPYGYATSAPYYYAGGAMGLLEEYADGRHFVWIGHAHLEHWKRIARGENKRGGWYITVPRPDATADGFVSQGGYDADDENLHPSGGHLHVNCSQSKVTATAIRAWTDDVELDEPSDGIMTNGATVATLHVLAPRTVSTEDSDMSSVEADINLIYGATGPSVAWDGFTTDAGVARDLDGSTLKMCVGDTRGHENLAEILSSDGGLTISTDVVTLVSVSTITALEPKCYYYSLWLIGEPATSDEELAHGKVIVAPAVIPDVAV